MTDRPRYGVGPGFGGHEGRLSDTDSYKRDHLIRVIECSVEGMTLKELEALSYDMFTKGYIEADEL